MLALGVKRTCRKHRLKSESDPDRMQAAPRETPSLAARTDQR